MIRIQNVRTHCGLLVLHNVIYKIIGLLIPTEGLLNYIQDNREIGCKVIIRSST